MTKPKQLKVRIYTCVKHPSWSLESTAPVMAASLKQHCPLCRDEFWTRTIGEADCRIEMRDVPEKETP